MTADSSLTDSMYSAAVRAFEDWRKAFPNERVFAFALSTIDDAIYVNASLNSEEAHQRRLAKRNLEPSSVLGLDAKWGPWEWENEYTGQAHFAAVDGQLKEMYKNSDEDSFPLFKATVVDSMVEALVSLRKNQIVTNNGDPSGIVMFATIYTSFAAEALHRRSAELLNAPGDIQELLAAIGG